MAQYPARMRWPTGTSSLSWRQIQTRSRHVGCRAKINFTEFSGEFARVHFGKRHEPSARVGSHGEAALERYGAVSSANPGPEDKGVAVVDGDGWLDGD
jgi:hypothetical protein